METKKVYQYKKIEGKKELEGKYYYDKPLSLDDSDKSPSGSWNISALCTELEPLSEKEGFRILWNGNGWEYEEIPKNPEPPEPTLEELKKTKKAELKAERDLLEVQHIEYNVHSFDYDEKVSDRINAAIIALELQGPEANIEWTLADNTSISVTASDLKNVIGTVAVRSNELHVTYRAVSDKVDTAETKEELYKITS